MIINPIIAGGGSQMLTGSFTGGNETSYFLSIDTSKYHYIVVLRHDIDTYPTPTNPGTRASMIGGFATTYGYNRRNANTTEPCAATGLTVVTDYTGCTASSIFNIEVVSGGVNLKASTTYRWATGVQYDWWAW